MERETRLGHSQFALPMQKWAGAAKWNRVIVLSRACFGNMYDFHRTHTHRTHTHAHTWHANDSIVWTGLPVRVFVCFLVYFSVHIHAKCCAYLVRFFWECWTSVYQSHTWGLPSCGYMCHTEFAIVYFLIFSVRNGCPICLVCFFCREIIEHRACNKNTQHFILIINLLCIRSSECQ